jgi:hypothetical protein
MSEFAKGGLIPPRENRPDIVEVVLKHGYVWLPEQVREKYRDTLDRLNQPRKELN